MNIIITLAFLAICNIILVYDAFTKSRIVFTLFLLSALSYPQQTKAAQQIPEMPEQDITSELKPRITKVSYVKQNNDGFDSYNVVCEVEYKGADYLYVTLEEEFGSKLQSQFVREPHLAHFTCKNINSNYYAWIDIVVENDYGKDTYTIDLPPLSSGITDKSANNADFSEIRIYNIKGENVKTIHNFSETASLDTGLYILKYYKGNMIVKTSKLLK